MTATKPVSLLLAVTLLLLTACSKTGQQSAPPDNAPRISGVTTETVRTQQLADSFDAAGTVHSRTSTVVSPRVPGTITVMNAREGTRVKKGELLARIDARENQANAAAATGAAEDARRALDESKARKNLANAQFERYQKLFKADAVSRQEFEIKETEKELAQQGVARAEARLQQAQEQAKSAGAFADYTRILAPISGIIVSRQADLGATVFPGQPVFTIEDESSYQLELAIPESIALKVKPGTVVQVTLDAISTGFAGTITEIVPAADPLSRTFIAKIPLNQKGLKSGMFGRGAVNLGTSVNGITVPKRSLVERGAMTSVWILDKDKTAKMRLVKAGKNVGERIEILAGLGDGDTVIVSGVEKVTEGVKVE